MKTVSNPLRRAAPLHPRDVRGRILSRDCPDPDCGGRLQWEPETRFGIRSGAWRCDGLTHETQSGPLVACEYAVLPPAAGNSVQAMPAPRGAGAPGTPA